MPQRHGGAVTSDRQGASTGFALDNLQKRTELLIGPYRIRVRGHDHRRDSRPDEMPANPTKAKQLTNIRASGSDGAIKLTPLSV
jgi:GTP-binding protein